MATHLSPAPKKCLQGNCALTFPYFQYSAPGRLPSIKYPPSIVKIWPVMYRARYEARNTMPSAIHAASAISRSGTRM